MSTHDLFDVDGETHRECEYHAFELERNKFKFECGKQTTAFDRAIELHIRTGTLGRGDISGVLPLSYHAPQFITIHGHTKNDIGIRSDWHKISQS